MNVLTFGSFGSSIPQSSQAATASANGCIEKAFLDYMKESPGQRMVDAWLKAHHLTEDDLKKMSPQKREAIEKQMAEDIKNDMERRAETKTAGGLYAL